MFYQAAALSLAAGLIHVFASFDYWGVWWGYAIFFLLLAMLQVSYGIVLFMRPWHYDESGRSRDDGGLNARSFLTLGAAATAAIIALWLFAHLVVTPFGPQAGQREPITLLSLAALLVMAAQTAYLVHLLQHLGKTTKVAQTYAGDTGTRWTEE